MKMKFMSLASLFKAQKDDDEDEKDPKDAADKKKAPKDDSKDDGSGDGGEDQEEKDKKKKDDKKKKSETDDDTDDSDESGDGKSATVTNSVHLALDDFNQLMALASTAKSVSAENKKLKAKADEWDNYQAALSGGKSEGDTAGGSKGKDAKETGKTAVELLREKHGAALVD